MTLTVSTNVNAAAAAPEGIPSVGVATNTLVRRDQSIPMFVPADQLYYWSFAWQGLERDSRADLEAGRSRTFDDPTAAVRYLLGSDR
jgi:hypothetical protein